MSATVVTTNKPNRAVSRQQGALHLAFTNFGPDVTLEKRMSARFAEDLVSVVAPRPSQYEITEDLQAELWYTPEEYDQIQRDIQHHLLLLQTNRTYRYTSQEDDRGLEIQKGFPRERANRLHGFRQELVRLQRKGRPESRTQVLRDYSLEAGGKRQQELAELRAMKDVIAAERIYKESKEWKLEERQPVKKNIHASRSYPVRQQPSRRAVPILRNTTIKQQPMFKRPPTI